MTEKTMTPVLGDATIEELRKQLRGGVITPNDDAYHDARSVWNGAIDRHPAFIVRCTGTADIIDALRFARSENLAVAVRGGGHNVAGFGTCDDGIVIDLSPMKGTRVDPITRTVRAQGGVLWGELDRETQTFGLATTGGLVSTTGIAGFTLGGGIGWLMRRHGLAADNLRSADVVTADGTVVTADTDTAPDLLWGLRGGGGNFGIVTSFDFQLHPVGPIVYGGAIFHPAERAAELLRFYTVWTRTLPDELTTMMVFLTAPPEPFIPTELQGTPMVAVACCHIGEHDDAEEAVKPLREFGQPAADVIGPIPYGVLQSLFDGSAPRGLNTYWKTAYLDDLDEPGIDELVARAAGLPDLFHFSSVHIHHLEGAVGEQPPGGSAFAHRGHRFVLNLIGTWQDEEGAQASIDWVRESWETMQPHTTGDPYLNFLGDEGTDRVRAAYGSDAYDRLVDLKTRYDPDNVFQLNQNIIPR